MHSLKARQARQALVALSLATVLGCRTAGAATVTVDVETVRSDAGRIVVSLCGDPKAPFPGACTTHGAAADAARGRVTITLPDVAPGRYALQAYHDENGNGRPDTPPEGYAFGNDVGFPPAFDAAAIKVDGDVRAHLTLSYPGGAAPARPAMGSRGAEPPAGVRRVDLREQGLYGELYLPAGGKPPAPGLLLIGGSEGGLDTISQMAASFAQAGYASLALAYWNEQGLPSRLEGIPLEYFDRALTWLARRPEVDAKAMAGLGWSRGAEAILLVGTRNPRMRAVIAVAPSSQVWQGLPGGSDGHAAWTVAGMPLPFLIPDASRYRADMTSLRPLFEARMSQADARPDTAIPVERLRGPLLLISGSDDQIWPSQRFAERIVARAQGAAFRPGVQHLAYEGAGHFVFVGAPDGMLSRAAGAANGGMMGGTRQANAAAWQDNWPRTLAFLSNALKGTAK